ncbi:MAG: inorganic phosphate transporter [Ignavibacteria bacterium]|nr:MAG: inorganic phosphate transporter [Ignavibacteria bacterium]
MEIYLFIIIILFVLAVSDLIVGVGNDAVNFLNSAFGSRVAPRHVILLVASAGIIAGTIFSSGMMEVARKGIFHPQHFYFPELMTIFLAVMLTDIILLDFFNTFGMPTSTTVSIVFELLGSAFAVSIIKIISNSQDMSMLVEYINTSKAIAIISGILLSIVVAFSVGAIVQFIARMVFTFDYKKKMARYGGLFGGVAMTSVTFFIVIKGAKGAAFMTPETKHWIMHNADMIILFSLIIWSLIFQFLYLLKVNILRIIVLLGTFALALAFAANDLVNFIGVPIAGLNSFQIAQGLDNPTTTLMEQLQGKIATDPWLLILAGFVMIGTLYFNKKARGVIQTSLDLGRQYEGDERFSSSPLARSIVRANLALSDGLIKLLPDSFIKFLRKRFEGANKSLFDEDGNPVSFDLIRASVNLIVASILISIATSWKLPLSTTYVTFMVAMGTSLSDKAWGRDSAVYRINGVITVIGGWFFTAFIAFTIAGIFATIIYFGKLIAIIGLSLLAVYFIYRTHKLHSKQIEAEEPEEAIEVGEETSVLSTLDKINNRYKKFFSNIIKYLGSTLDAFAKFERDVLKENVVMNKKIKKTANKIVNEIIFIIKNLSDSEVKKGRRYGKIMGATQDISYNVRSLIQMLFDHVNNNHRPLPPEKNNNIVKVNDALTNQLKAAMDYFEDNSKYPEFVKKTELITNLLQELDEQHVNMLRNESTGDYSSRGNMLYLDILTTADNISSQLFHLVTVINKNYVSLKEQNGKD